MLTLSLNSKKCLAVSLCFGLALPQLAWASKQNLSSSEVLQTLKKQLQSRRTTDFEPLLKTWGKTYGPGAVAPLLTIAHDQTLPDPDRYVALMGGAKLGGPSVAPKIEPLLKDPSWMIRSAALRALTGIRAPQAGKAALVLLKDPALVLRLDAVQVVDRLQPPGAATALLAALDNSANYHQGKAQWVPQHALAALARLNPPELEIRLKPLLDRRADNDFHAAVVQTLEKVTHRAFKRGRPIPEQVKAWKLYLSTRKKSS